jgi:hypothetical protein
MTNSQLLVSMAFPVRSAPRRQVPPEQSHLAISPHAAATNPSLALIAYTLTVNYV